MMRGAQTASCPPCRKPHPVGELFHGETVGRPITDLIQKTHPDWSSQDVICRSCLKFFRAEYVQEVLESQKGELSTLEAEVIKSFKEQEILAHDLTIEFDRQLTPGQRVADQVAEFEGRWTFILSFGDVLVLWLLINSTALLRRSFDPFPYILLNLVLSCVAAFQAPIIMMSRNRQEAKDRMRAEHDYQLNLKAELEIRQLTWKVDQLLNHQWQRLLEIQQIQTELIEELVRKRGPTRGG